MKLHAVEGNTQRLDGGSMFGNAPKTLWSRWLEPDERNRIHLACRSLHLETDEGRHILFDVGIGAFFEPKLKDRYGVVEKEHMLLANLASIGLEEGDIDAVILSHLHFDHAGGLLSTYDGASPRLLFPNATIYTSAPHWGRAIQPHIRERASFLPELHSLLEESNRLELLTGERVPELPHFLSFRFVDGHTVGSMVTIIDLNGTPLAFVADLIPGMPWMHLPITMGYDRFPELLVDEKRELLEWLYERDGYVFFTHDPSTPCAKVDRDEKGRFCGTPTAIDTLTI